MTQTSRGRGCSIQYALHQGRPDAERVPIKRRDTVSSGAISIGFVVAPSKVRPLITVRTMSRCGFAFQETKAKKPPDLRREVFV